MHKKIGTPKDRISITLKKRELKSGLDNLTPNGDYGLKKTIEKLQHAYNKIQ